MAGRTRGGIGFWQEDEEVVCAQKGGIQLEKRRPFPELAQDYGGSPVSCSHRCGPLGVPRGRSNVLAPVLGGEL